MKTYRLKSLFFLACFILAAIVYHKMEQQDDFLTEVIGGNETAKLEMKKDLGEEENRQQ